MYAFVSITKVYDYHNYGNSNNVYYIIHNIIFNYIL